MKLKIGNVTLENNLILAPMAGVTDLPFRILCKEQGCGMVVTEMVSAKAILYKNRNTKALLEVEAVSYTHLKYSEVELAIAVSSSTIRQS